MTCIPASPSGGVAQAFYLNSSRGELAAMYRSPSPAAHHFADILYAHPFGHELFNSRPVMALVFRALAAMGVGVLSLDLPGCGDSYGDFGDARWENWRDALLDGAAWLRSRSKRPLSLCGLRLGAALAIEVARECAPIDRLILLQPVLNGREMMTAYLRLRVAFSGLRGDTTAKETTDDLRRRIAQGESLEVAGYTLAPDLVASIDSLDLTTCRDFPAAQIHWVETETSKDFVRTVASWEKNGAQVQIHTVPVKPYWTHTRALATVYEPLSETLQTIFK